MNTDTDKDKDEKRRRQEKLENKDKKTAEGSAHEPLFPCPICKRTHKKSVRCSPR